MLRTSIVGAAGCGKSTLGGALSAYQQCPLVELDQLYWQPGWQPTPAAEFQSKVAAALAGQRWIACGNYSAVRELVWQRADTIIWLDYPLPLTLYWLYRRTWRRIVSQEELWGGNRESWHKQFLSRDSLLLYTLRTHKRRRMQTEALLAESAYAHLSVLHFRHPREAAAWMAGIVGAQPATV